jgi:hypothetical protein
MKQWFRPSDAILLPSLVDDKEIIDGERRIVAHGGEDKLSKESLRGAGLPLQCKVMCEGGRNGTGANVLCG